MKRHRWFYETGDFGREWGISGSCVGLWLADINRWAASHTIRREIELGFRAVVPFTLAYATKLSVLVKMLQPPFTWYPVTPNFAPSASLYRGK